MRRLWGGLVVLVLVAGCSVSRVGGNPDGPEPNGPIQLAVPIELARVPSSAPPSTSLPVPSGSSAPEPTTSGAPSASLFPPAPTSTSATPSTSASGPRVLPDPEGVLLTLDEPFLVITTLDDADVGNEQTTWSVVITLNEADGAVFSDWTENHVDEQVAMIAGDEIVAAPTIQAHIPGREVSITAQYTRDEAEDLLARITGR